MNVVNEFSYIRNGVSLSKNSPKTLDPSYKMDLDFWDYFEGENPVL